MVEKKKQCNKCKKWKLLSAFYKHLTCKGGVRPDCKECNYQIYKVRNNKRKKKHYQTHKIETLERHKKYRKTRIGYIRHLFNCIKQRCNNSKYKYYKNYGGRNIKCLFNSSNEFVNYIINELQIDPRGLQIDRINNDGNYEPGNIRFVTAKVNSNNRRKRK